MCVSPSLPDGQNAGRGDGATVSKQTSEVSQTSEASVDPNFMLKADHSPRLTRWTVVQREQFWIY